MAPGIHEDEGVIRGPMNEENQKALIEAAAKKTKTKSKPKAPESNPEGIAEPGPSRRDIDVGTVNESSGDDGSPDSGRNNVNEETGVGD